MAMFSLDINVILHASPVIYLAFIPTPAPRRSPDHATAPPGPRAAACSTRTPRARAAPSRRSAGTDAPSSETHRLPRAGPDSTDGACRTWRDLSARVLRVTVECHGGETIRKDDCARPGCSRGCRGPGGRDPQQRTQTAPTSRSRNVNIGDGMAWRPQPRIASRSLGCWTTRRATVAAAARPRCREVRKRIRQPGLTVRSDRVFGWCRACLGLVVLNIRHGYLLHAKSSVSGYRNQCVAVVSSFTCPV